MYKKWVLLSFAILIVMITVLSIFNFLTNPLWNFDNFLFTKYKHSYNERILKTNLLVFSDIELDGILIGSSRSTFIKTLTKYKNKYKIFNYSVASLQVNEYEGLIDNVKKIKEKDLSVVIIGLDFFTYLSESRIDNFPNKYLADTQDYMYRVKTLLSYDTFKKGKKNLKIKNTVHERVYDKNYNLFISKNNEEENQKNILNSVKKFKKRFFTNPKPVANFGKYLKSTIANNPNTKFIVYTTPVSKELLEVIVKDKNLYSLYEKWLNEVVSIFGEVNHFMFLSKFAKKSSANFYDSHHAYPDTVNKLYSAISLGKENENLMRINKDNFKQMIKNLRKINLVDNEKSL